MYLKVPTWLLFLFLCIAAFAPGVSRWPDWWLAYYGALFVCWVLLSVTAVRRAALELRIAQRRLATRQTTGTQAAETVAKASGSPPDETRLIVVARDNVDVSDRIRRDQVGDRPVTIITDRRSGDRRRLLQVYIPERRQAERRRHNITPLLHAQGWAEVSSPSD